MLAYLAVAVGGLIGTGLRLACDLAFPHADGDFPVETLLVNLVGAFVLGWLVGGLWTRPTTPTWFKAGLGSGLIGSFTTLSAVMASLIVLTGVFPRRDRPELNASIAAINAKLAAFGDAQRVRYVDIGDRLVDSRGELTEQMSEDGLHLSLAAYQIWADALKPILVERLGAALDVDFAPAATGNPAAR